MRWPYIIITTAQYRKLYKADNIFFVYSGGKWCRYHTMLQWRLLSAAPSQLCIWWRRRYSCGMVLCRCVPWSCAKYCKSARGSSWLPTWLQGHAYPGLSVEGPTAHGTSRCRERKRRWCIDHFLEAWHDWILAEKALQVSCSSTPTDCW